MTKPAVPLNLLGLICCLSLLAAQCQPGSNAPPPSPTTTPAATPTVLLIPPPQPGDGSDLLDRLLERGVIRVGIRVWPQANFSPPAFRGFSNAETGGALNGFEVDVAHQVAQGLGLQLELVEAYPPIIAAGDWRGEWDIAIAGLVPFDQPAANAVQPLAYSRPYGYIPLGFLRSSAAAPIQTVDQLAGRPVGVLEHSAYQRLLTPEEQPLTVQGQPLTPPLPVVQVVVVSNLIHSIQGVGQPNTPAFLFGPTPIFQEAIEQEAPVELAAANEQLGRLPLAIAAVPQDGLRTERLLQAINIVLDHLQRQGVLGEIYIRWYDQDFSRPP